MVAGVDHQGFACTCVASGANKGQSWELPSLGKLSWENAVAAPKAGNRTIVIGTDGSMRADDNPPFATLGLAAFNDPRTELVGDLPNTYSATAAPTSTDYGQVVQGYLEESNVNPTAMMTQMVEVNRAYEAAQKLVQTQDDLLGRVISTLGRL